MNQETKAIINRIVQVFLTLFVEATILFVSSGDPMWFWGWLFVLANFGLLLINAMILPREVIIERGRRKEGVKRWDRIITGLMMIPLITMFIISGLDHRYGWSESVPGAYNIIGILFGVFGDAIIVWAMRVNIYFSTMVRIQQERGHKTVTDGPYQCIRHPGYFGMIFGALSTPMLLGSYAGMIPVILYIILIVIRTKLEDKTLYNELAGYREYMEKVRYRLIPYVW
jgi:protein-S-isoprenylcysteine O-methyltransferase Ste14